MLIGRWRRGRFNMIVKAAMFVVDDDQKSRFPEVRIGANGVVNVRNQLLRFEDVMGRMIVVLIGSEILRFDQDKRWKAFFVTDIGKEILDQGIAAEIFGEALPVEQERTGKIIVVNSPGLSSLAQPIE